jgi:hypothetical protein
MVHTTIPSSPAAIMTSRQSEESSKRSSTITTRFDRHGLHHCRSRHTRTAMTIPRCTSTGQFGSSASSALCAAELQTGGTHSGPRCKISMPSATTRDMESPFSSAKQARRTELRCLPVSLTQMGRRGITGRPTDLHSQ